MGRIVVEQIVSADGFAADAAGGTGFFEAVTDFTDTADEQFEFLRGVDAIVLGRVTYELFVDYWPTADASDEPISVPINTLPRHVFSSTLDTAPWGRYAPAAVERSDATIGVPALRDQYEGDLVIWGSLTLTDALFRAGLVDHLRLRVVPVLLGRGRSFVPADLDMRRLRLIELTAHSGGHIGAGYDLV